MRNVLSFHKKQGWKPGANTIAYYPLTSETTINDMSGNNRNLTQVDKSTFGTYLGVNCVYVYGSSQSGFHCLYNRNVSNQTLGNKFTVSFWGSRLNQNTNSIICGMGGIDGRRNGYNIYGNSSNVENEVLNNGSINKITYSKTISVGEWHLYTAVYDNGNSKLYVDGTLGASGNYTVGTINVIGVGISFGTETTGYSYQGNGYLSNYILENKARTAQEVANYYNQTKSNYESTLKTYEEIVAIGNCVDVVNELNQHPLEYLSSLKAEGHIYRTYSEIMYIDLLTNTSDSDRVRLKETSSSSRTFNIWYAEGDEEWTYGSPASIPA